MTTGIIRNDLATLARAKKLLSEMEDAYLGFGTDANSFAAKWLSESSSYDHRGIVYDRRLKLFESPGWPSGAKVGQWQFAFNYDTPDAIAVPGAIYLGRAYGRFNPHVMLPNQTAMGPVFLQPTIERDEVFEEFKKFANRCGALLASRVAEAWDQYLSCKGQPKDHWLLSLFMYAKPEVKEVFVGTDGSHREWMATLEGEIGPWKLSLKLLDTLIPKQETRDFNDGDCNDLARHSIDFVSVYWFGKQYEFTTNQAACIKVLWEAWERSVPTLAQETILDAAGISQHRLDMVFRNHPAWAKMITSPHKGKYRLNESSDQ